MATDNPGFSTKSNTKWIAFILNYNRFSKNKFVLLKIKILPGFVERLAESRSDKMDVVVFVTFGTFGILIADGCVTPAVTVTFGGDVSESRVGVIFFLRPRFLAAGSSKSSGGLPNSDGSKSRVFCTSSTVDGMICSRFCARPRIMGVVGCGIIDGIARGGGSGCCRITDECAMTEDVC